MDYDSGSSCEGRLKDLEDSEDRARINEISNKAEREFSTQSCQSRQWYNPETTTSIPNNLPVVSKRSLSAQVMEYYHKYSQNSSLGRYFSLPEPGITSDPASYRRRMYTSKIESCDTQESYVILAEEERCRLDSGTPRERRKWARPPLIGQPSTCEDAVTSTYVAVSAADSRTPSPISKRPITETIPEERNESRETLVEIKDNEMKPISSPTSSVTSHKPLEWDSGADVGYYNALPRSKEKDKNLCTIERMALARGCSAALRLDPEGTNETTCQKTNSRITSRTSMKPDANSTPLVGHISGDSESEIEITPIVKSHLTSMIKGREETTREPGNDSSSREENEFPKLKTNIGAPPVQIKYPTEGSRSKETKKTMQLSPLKKSSSMNLLALPLSRLSLKRSQSELNLRGRERKPPTRIFDSTSSIATVVNKPTTCDKFIQTSLDGYSRESIGIQVEVETEESEKSNEESNVNEETNESTKEEKEEDAEKEEEKPPLPKRASSLVPKSLHSILKNSSNTYTVRDRNVPITTRANGNNSNNLENTQENRSNEDRVDGPSRTRYRIRGGGGRSDVNSSSERSRNDSSSLRSESLVEETTEENAAGRASNSFEYFPGHVYQNVPNGSTSHVSSIDTGRESRCSTMPNTSSSIDEKLWGDSDSLVRDLERSVNILKSLVDANKCDKQVKKRLIHHVIKRLVTAKYTDDRIEHDLEENVPWNPADARNKVYRNDIIQALVNKHNTTDSSPDDWRPRKRNVTRGNSLSPKKTMTNESRVIKEIIDLAAASSRASTINSDKFPFDRHTDRTLMDGRKARMTMRNEDQRRDTDTNGEKSESSECFMPQSQQHKANGTNVFYSVEKNNEQLRETPTNIARDAPTMTTSATTITTSTSTSHRNLMSNRIVLVKERQRTGGNETDWRLPTTMSERRFELGRCNTTGSGDTTLINYAEMEKRNQLVWITNEISHLCNLKRLLEEPNRVETRTRGGSSPRKRLDGLPIGQWIARAHAERNSSSRTDRARETGSEAAANDIPRDDLFEKALETRWSSHGNLPSGRSDQRAARKREDDRVDRVGHTRKRNSCTQTGSDGGPSGHSKTGGEIISATMPVLASMTSVRVDREMALDMRDASIQTRSISPEKKSNVVSTSSQVLPGSATGMGHSSNCRAREQSRSTDDVKIYQEPRRHVCYCQRYAAHSRHRACIIHSPQRCSREHSKNCPRRSIVNGDERPIINQPIVNQIIAPSAKSMDSRKEAKNQLNATCKSNYAIRELPGKSKARCARCDEEKISSIPEVPAGVLKTATKNLNDNEVCLCPRDCECDDEAQSTGSEGNRESNEEIVSPCCETGSEIDDETRRCGNSLACQGCTCDLGKHSWANKEKGRGSGIQNSRKNVATTETNGVEKACKSCRTCGTIWPVKDGKNANRKCKCSQDYLKPVAYELKFDETIKDKPRNHVGKKSKKIDKIFTKGLSTNSKTQSKATQSTPIAEMSPRNDDCDENAEEDDEKDEDENENEGPGTLKDFLATNRPEFLDNVETRRRYMSELSQLRQLKREKRKQFLAMAGASGFLKPQRPVKGTTVNAQRKLSEYELKLRLRMRYLRLNEVRNKRRQREKEEDARRNHLMAKLFGQKLQQKVLKGQVDLSQSVSVISNL